MKFEKGEKPMLGVYANSLMIAARTENVTVVDAPKPYEGGLSLKRFMPRKRKVIDVSKL